MVEKGLAKFCSHRYILVTVLIVVFGFLLYLVQYEDIGSKLQLTGKEFRLNLGMTKHTFTVKEYQYNNGVLEVIGNYDDNGVSKENVVLRLKNLSSNQYPIPTAKQQKPFLKPENIIVKAATKTSMEIKKEKNLFKDSINLRKQVAKPTSISLKSVNRPSVEIKKETNSFQDSINLRNQVAKPTDISLKLTARTKITVEKEKTKEAFPDSSLFKTGQIYKSIDCQKLIEGDEEEQDKAKHLMEKPKEGIKPEVFINLTRNCNLFKTRYITSSLTKEEEEFPIAYSMLVFKDVDQVERLLRSIYRPQNYYCIHIDIKSKKSFRKAITKISSCFDNVLITPKSVDVRWGTFTVLEPELICLKELWRYKKWKYFINLTGQEFPLRTNLELVKILKIYNGANDMEGTVKRANKNRWEKAGNPPHGIIPTKGSVHITANRDFIDYILHNQTAKDFLEWVKKVDVPDETFFTSLNHNPQLHIPGSYTDEPETDTKIKPFLTRFKNWGMGPFNWDCHGQRVRLICVFGIGDLPLLSKRPEFFANKFYNYYEPFALDCMEELHYNRTRDEYLKKTTFNTTFYENLEFIKHIVHYVF